MFFYYLLSLGISKSVMMYNLRSRQTRNDSVPKNSNPPVPKPVKAVKSKPAKPAKPAKPVKRGTQRERVSDESKQEKQTNDVDLDATIPIEEFMENLKRKTQEDDHNVETKAKKAKIDTPVVSVGSVMTFGDDFCGELGLKKTGFTKKRPVSIEIEEKVSQVACGGMHTVCLTIDGEIYTWGCNDEGALGRQTDNPPKGHNLEAEPSKMPFSLKVKKVTAGDSHSAALTINGEVYIWGNFKVIQLINSSSTLHHFISILTCFFLFFRTPSEILGLYLILTH